MNAFDAMAEAAAETLAFTHGHALPELSKIHRQRQTAKARARKIENGTGRRTAERKTKEPKVNR